MDELVELIQVSPKIRLQLLYATPNNFTGRIVYPSGRCFLRKKVAERLHRVQCRVEEEGVGLKVWDGYRPHHVQELFWKLCPDPRFVADPKVGSKHSRGASVDLTLVDQRGKELLMPTEFDDFSERASHSYREGDKEAIARRNFLKKMMESEGFIPYENEWWHYDDPEWMQYSLLDIPI